MIYSMDSYNTILKHFLNLDFFITILKLSKYLKALKGSFFYSYSKKTCIINLLLKYNNIWHIRYF